MYLYTILITMNNFIRAHNYEGTFEKSRKTGLKRLKSDEGLSEKKMPITKKKLLMFVFWSFI